MTQRRSSTLTLVVPALAVVFVGVIWFAGKSSLPRWSARLWVPKTAANHLVMRAQVKRFPSNSSPGVPLAVEALIKTSQGEVHRLSGLSTSDGVIDWDVWLPAASAGYDVQLRQAGDAHTVLVTGHWNVEELTKPLTLRHAPTTVRLRPNNSEVEFTLRHGALTVPIPDQLQVSWHGSNVEATLELEISGARGLGGQPLLQWVNGQKQMIQPTEHLVEVGVHQTDKSGETSSGFGILPVVPGAIAARLGADSVLSVVSPVPRGEAFLALATLDETIALATVPLRLHRDGQGAVVYLGQITLPDALDRVASSEQVWAVTSSEFDLESEAQLGSPLREAPLSGHSTRFGWGKVMDGVEQQITLAGAQRDRWRWIAWGGLVIACALELGLIFLHTRGAGRPLHEQVAVDRGAPYWLVVGCVILGFSGLGSLFCLW